MTIITDPLAADVERFPLTAPAFAPPAAGDEPSPCRPFGLRFVPLTTPGEAVSAPRWRLCPVRQIAVTEDGTPAHRTIIAMTMKTTGPSSDGGPSTGGEEYRPD